MISSELARPFCCDELFAIVALHLQELLINMWPLPFNIMTVHYVIDTDVKPPGSIMLQ